MGRLDNGLSAIFNESYDDMLRQIQDKAEVLDAVLLPIEKIMSNPYQPRKHFNDEKLKELSESIQINGVISPIGVQVKDAHYIIVFGERRWRASQLIGLTKIPAIILDLDDKQLMEISLLENIQREDLNVIEEAQGYAMLMESFQYTQEDLALRVSKSREYVANLLRLLKLPSLIQMYIVEEKMTAGHARCLLTLKDNNLITEVANKIIELNLNVRETELFVKKYKVKNEVKEYQNVEVNHEQEEVSLADFFKTRVIIKKKKFEVYFEDEEDLKRIITYLSYLKNK
ncbi:MAG: ParB/RepB/Spo0J family partition protein [Erysipelotrichaceae bacterium]